MVFRIAKLQAAAPTGVREAPLMAAEIPNNAGVSIDADDRKQSGWILVAIVFSLLAGAALRLVLLGNVEFKLDEATIATQVTSMLHNHILATHRTDSSVGFLLPPFFDYLMIPPFLVSSNPQVATGYVALLNILALALYAVMVYRFFGPRTAFFATLLYALAPWAVVYSRKIWAPDTESLFVVITIWGMLALLIERRHWSAFAIVASWLWLVQIHTSAALLAPVVLVVLWFGRRAVRPLALALGLIAGILPLLPYLAYERSQGWGDVLPALKPVSHAAIFTATALVFTLQNATSFDTLQLEGVPVWDYLPVWVVQALTMAGTVLVVVAALAAALALARPHRLQPRTDQTSGQRFASGGTRRVPRSCYALVLAWVIVPVLLITHHGTPLFPHYFLYSLPVIFVVVAAGLDALCAWLGPLVTRITVAITVTYALLATIPLLALYGYLRSPANVDFGFWRNSQALVQAAEHAAPGGSVALTMPPETDQSVVLHYRFAEQDPTIETPPTVAVLNGAMTSVVVGSPTTSIAGQLLQAATGSRIFHFAANQPALAMVPLTPAEQAAAIQALRPLNVHLANGVTYLGWAPSYPDARTLRITLVWRLDRVAPTAVQDDDAIYIHLVRGSTMYAQHDGMDYSAKLWTPGVTVWSWYDIPLPATLAPGPYDLRTGMYTRPGIQRVPMMGPNGPQDGEFSLGTVTVQ